MPFCLRSTVLCLIILLGVQAVAQDLQEYKRKFMVTEQDTLPYRILFPKDYDPDRTYPLLLFLHGSGERGKDNELQLLHGGDLFVREDIRENYPAFVVFPQCPEGVKWNNSTWVPGNGARDYTFPEEIEPNRTLDLLNLLFLSLRQTYTLDLDRIYIGGLSMGAMGTFEMVQRNPGVFAAAFAICGGAHPLSAPRLVDTSWWLFHGTDDTTVPVFHSRAMFEAMKTESIDVQLTEYPGVNHDSWTNAFAEPGLLPWLFSQHR
jgi:predicted peptidase